MAAPWADKKTPKLLKATYMADQEVLLEETRASKLLYFPGPFLWSLVFGVLTYLTWAAHFHWPTSGLYRGYLFRFGKFLHLSHATISTDLGALFTLLFVAGLLWLAVRYVRWIRTVYAVTSRRVIVQRGIVGRDFDEIPVTQVRGVDVKQSVGQRILGYGTVRVSSEQGGRSGIGNEDWVGIPKPFRFQKWVENATEALQTPGSGPSPAPGSR